MRFAQTLSLGIGLLALGTAWAGRPLLVDDAGLAGSGAAEVELGAAYVDVEDCRHWDFPAGLTYGLQSWLDVSVGFGGQFEERVETVYEAGEEDCIRESGLSDLVVGVKWLAMAKCPLGEQHGLSAALKLPTADEDKGLGSGEMDFDATWIVTRSFGEKFSVHLNGGYSWIGEPAGEEIGDVFHGGLAADYQAREWVQLVGEVSAERELLSGADWIVQYNIGVRWNASDDLVIDLAAGSGIEGDAPDFSATAGLTWAFDLNGKTDNP